MLTEKNEQFHQKIEAQDRRIASLKVKAAENRKIKGELQEKLVQSKEDLRILFAPEIRPFWKKR